VGQPLSGRALGNWSQLAERASRPLRQHGTRQGQLQGASGATETGAEQAGRPVGGESSVGVNDKRRPGEVAPG